MISSSPPKWMVCAALGFCAGRRGGRFSFRNAFTLVEVALAIGVAAVALVSVFVVIQSGFKTYEDAMNSSITSAIAQEVMSDYLLADFGKLVAQSSEGGQSGLERTTFYDERGLALDASHSESAIYRCVSKVLNSSVLGIDRDKLLSIRITVTSPTRPSLEKVYSFFIARQGEDTP